MDSYQLPEPGRTKQRFRASRGEVGEAQGERNDDDCRRDYRQHGLLEQQGQVEPSAALTADDGPKEVVGARRAAMGRGSHRCSPRHGRRLTRIWRLLGSSGGGAASLAWLDGRAAPSTPLRRAVMLCKPGAEPNAGRVAVSTFGRRQDGGTRSFPHPVPANGADQNIHPTARRMRQTPLRSGQCASVVLRQGCRTPAPRSSTSEGRRWVMVSGEP